VAGWGARWSAGVGGAVGGALLGVDPVDGGAGSLSVRPLGRVVRLGGQGPVGVGDLVVMENATPRRRHAETMLPA
jgi:hypothetical protein